MKTVYTWEAETNIIHLYISYRTTKGNSWNQDIWPSEFVWDEAAETTHFFFFLFCITLSFMLLIQN